MTVANIPTRRPSPSAPEIEPADPIAELNEQVGKVMAEQVRLRTTVGRELQAFRVEHETYTRTVVKLHEDVRDLLEAHAVQGRVVKRAAKTMPALIAVLELARYLFENLQTFHH